jgi:dihydroneopterin aldolase
MNTNSDAPDGDRLIIEAMRLQARIGVYAHEKERQQTISLSLDVGLPDRNAHATDALDDTICYMALTDAMRSLAVSRHFNLVETLTEEIAQAVLGFGASWVKVRVEKVGIVPDARAVGISITRRAAIRNAHRVRSAR